MFKLTHQQRHWLDFLIAMTVKEIKARYKHAVLGFLWMLIVPLSQMLVMGFVFSFFIPVNIDNYFLFLFAGLLPWNFFAYSVTKTTPAFVYERSLIKKAKFPREAIVLSIILANLFHTVVSLGLLAILLIGDKLILESYTFAELFFYSARMLWFLPLLAWLLLLTSGLSLLTASLNVKYRDINFLVQMLMPLWFYITPVVYTLDLLPKYLAPLFYLNPMTAILEGFRYATMGLPVSALDLSLISLLMTGLLFGLGWWVFIRDNPYFDDWV